MINPASPNFIDRPGDATRPVYRYGEALCDTHPPLVTVVTPVWNTPAEQLTETARSVFSQSLRRIEWVLVNDASTAAPTLGALRELAAIPGVRVIDHPVNRGLPASRNTGVEHARADYIFLLDSDDLIEPTTLEKCLWYLRTHPADSFVKGFSVGFGGQGYLWSRGFEQRAEFLDRNQVTTTAMIRRATHRRVGGHDAALRTGPDDWDFWLRCAALGEWGATIPEYLDWYRRRENIVGGWNTIDREARRRWYLGEACARYPHLFTDPSAPDTGAAFNAAIAARQYHRHDNFAGDVHAVYEAVDNPIPRTPGVRRTVVVVDRLDTAHPQGINLALLDSFVRGGGGDDLTVIATGEAAPAPHADLPLVAMRTPDVFIARNYVPEECVEMFVEAIIQSRGADRVLRANLPVPAVQTSSSLRAAMPMASSIRR